jgi:ABC-type Fe3+ transport system permease subunit
MKFWIVWGIDAIIAGIALFFFVWGLSDGTVSSFNIGIWMALLAGIAIVVGGGLWLRSKGRSAAAMALLLILAIPGVLVGLFFLTLLIAHPRWN